IHLHAEPSRGRAGALPRHDVVRAARRPGLGRPGRRSNGRVARVRDRGDRARGVLRARLERGGGSLSDAQPGPRPVGARAHRARRAARHLDPAAAGAAGRDPAPGAAPMACRPGARAARALVGPVGWRAAHRRLVPAALARTDSMGDSWLETNGIVEAVNQTRMERDPLGEMPVPAEALWGIQTERARQNFPISGLRPLPAFVDAVIRIKKAAALTHRDTGRLEAKLADAIVTAADEVLAGGHREHFVVDPYQAGAGTSHNM